MLETYKESGEGLQVLPQMILSFFYCLMPRNRFPFLTEFRVSYYTNAECPVSPLGHCPVA